MCAPVRYKLTDNERVSRPWFQDSREMVAPPAEAMGDGDWATTKARFDERKNAGRS